MNNEKTSKYFLYGIYNITNGKLYIGISANCIKRWKSHLKQSTKTNKQAIHMAIAKYGKDNFIFKQIDECDNWNHACQLEIEWISFLKKEGYHLYNETNGGEGILGYKWTKEQRQKMSEMNSGSNNPMYGIKFFGADNPNFGKPIKQNVKEALLKSRRKLTNQQIKEIIDLYSTNNYSQTQLSKIYNISLTQIHRIIKGKSWREINSLQ